MINALPRGRSLLALLLAAAAALGASGCGTYRSENTVARKPPPATAASTTGTTATTAAPKPKPHPGWPKLVNCLVGRGFKAKKASGIFVVTTAQATDTTQVHGFPTAAAARAYAARISGLRDRVGRFVASYGTTAGAVRDGIRACGAKH